MNFRFEILRSNVKGWIRPGTVEESVVEDGGKQSGWLEVKEFVRLEGGGVSEPTKGNRQQ